MTLSRIAAVALCAAALGSGAPSAAAQIGPFGQNKIQYRNFDWHVLRGRHVDVYYYPAEEQIARAALGYAEQSYEYLQDWLQHHPRGRIPLIVYASHSDFEQTNVLPFVPPEGILGVTEYLKRRVTLPFRGSYSEFRGTLRHEMVHVFQLSIAARSMALYPRARPPQTPLWWSEGMAEFLSSPQDSRDEMVVRDLTIHANMPSIEALNLTESAIVYPLGGELHHFLARKYGGWRIRLLYESLWKYGSFTEAMASVYGRSVQQLSEEWHYDLRQRYFPAVAGSAPVEVQGREIAELALKPVTMRRRDGTVEVAYLSPRSGYTNIYRVPLDGHARPKVVVAGERTAEFESFHEFASRMDAKDGVLLFASKFGDRDALFFWDLEKGKVVGRYQFDHLVSILSPTWAPDGKRVAFSGLTDGGMSDLFVLDTRTGRLTRITDDRYEDVDPVWLPGGGSLVFGSDRTEHGVEGALNLYRIDLNSLRVMPLTAGAWRDESPRWDPEVQRVFFVSDRDSTFNLYSIDTLGNGRRETRLDGGVFDPMPVPGDGRVVISSFSDLSWDIYAIQPDSQAHAQQFATATSDGPPGTWTWAELSDSLAIRAPARRYRPQYSLDFAAGVASTGPSYASGPQGGQLVVSDLLGDHIFALSLASYQSTGGSDVLGNLNGSILYLNQAQRLNWGVGAYRVAGTFQENDFQQLYKETSVGTFGSIRYPLSRFTRVEGQVSVEQSSRDDFGNALVRGALRRKGILTGNFVSLVRDNSLWLNTGPIDGARYNLTGGVVSDITHGVFENWTGQADLRKYFRTSLQAAFALRAYGYVSEGTRPRAVQIAGSWSLRGYPRFSIAGTRAWLTNAEWRFPITNFVAVGFPFGVIRFPQIQGAFFGDLGQAWTRSFYDPRVLGSGGAGFRMALVPGLVLRLDVGRRFSLRGDNSNQLVSDFYHRRFVDFFIGYNY